MGEVYQARDVTLLRDVAVKILPGTPATDAVRVARFQQEARILASLNHPHIAQIYGFDHANGLSFLALELVEGENLAERIRRGPLKLSDAVELTRQIAEALDAAHERGIIHRDLKPANVMITRAGAVKLLDFGVAKVLAAADDAAETIAAETRAGSLIGTVAYMSPEQARADAVDKRADVWAFGCIVFEMLTATQAFSGRSSADVLAAILHDEPDWRLLPASVPTSVERLLRHCLTKDPRRRLRDIGDALFELESAGDDVGFSGGQTTRARWLAAVAVAVTAVTALGAGVLLGRRLAPASSGRAEGGSGGRFSIALPEGEHLASLEMPAVAISADGRRVAFVAGDTTARLFVRELDQPSGRLLAGTDGAVSPFFSPDGRSVGFFAGGRLKRVSIDGGDVVTVCGGASNPRGGAWNIDGTIAFAPAPGSALVQVDANGGQPRPLTTLDSKRGEGAQHWPEFLPGGDAIIYTSGTGTASSWDDRDIVLESLATHQRRIIAHGSSARYVASGHLVVARGGALMMLPFNLQQLQATGGPVRVADGVMQSEYGASQFSVSRNGSFVIVPGDQRERELVWISRNGAAKPLSVPPQTFWSIRLSPDGTRLALGIEGSSYAVWIYDLSRGTMTRQTFEGTSAYPIWTPDGKGLTFNSTRSGGVLNLFWRPADGSGEAERLATSDAIQIANSWSPDGRLLMYQDSSPSTGRDIWVWSRADRKSSPWLRTPYDEGGAMFSPDGRWLAYVSSEGGSANVYVRPFPGAGETLQISNDGGGGPVWSANGRELFYREPNGRMMAVDIEAVAPLRAGRPHVLFDAPRSTPIFQADYDVTRDGQQFIMFRPRGDRAPVTRIDIGVHAIRGGE